MKVTLKIMGRIFSHLHGIYDACSNPRLLHTMNRVEQVHNKCMKLRRNLIKSKKLVLEVAVG